MAFSMGGAREVPLGGRGLCGWNVKVRRSVSGSVPGDQSYRCNPAADWRELPRAVHVISPPVRWSFSFIQLGLWALLLVECSCLLDSVNSVSYVSNTVLRCPKEF